MRAFLNSDNCIEKRNSGFSLVELIVVIAILAVIGGAISAFVITSTNSYKHVSDEVDLQEEAQIVMNQLETLLMNAEVGVNYMYFGQTVTENPEDAVDVEGSLFSDSEISDGSIAVSQKTLYIYNSAERYVITWDEEKQTLNYRKENRNYDEVNGKYLTTFDEAGADDALLAEYIDGFFVSLTASEKGISVNVELHFVKEKYTYQTNQNIALRNSILLNEDAGIIYAVDGDATVTATYSGLVVRLGEQSFSAGSTNAYSVFLTGGADVSLPLSVTVSGSGFPSQEYTATLSDGTADIDSTAAGSRVEGKSIVISGSETADSLSLTVASKVSPSLKCVVTIDVKKISGVAISLGNGLTADSLRSGAQFSLGTTSASQIYATVSGSSNLSEDDKKCTWAAGENCTISGNTLRISSDTSAVGQEFSFTVYCASDSTVFYKYTGTIQPRNTTLALSGDSTVNRGGTVQFLAQSTDGTEIYDSDDIEWSVSVDNGGNGVFISDSGLLTVSGELDYNKAYTVTVTAALSYAPTVKKSLTVSVPAVGVEYAYSANGVYSDGFTVPMINVAYGNSYEVYYRLTGIEDGELSFRWNAYSAAGDDQTDSFSQTVTVGASVVTLKKVNAWASWGVYDYSGVYTMIGTPIVDGTALTGSALNVNNNTWAYNIAINSSSKNYFIPISETGGSVQLNDSAYYYVVEKVSGSYSYYRLTLTHNGITEYYYAQNSSSTEWISGVPAS